MGKRTTVIGCAVVAGYAIVETCSLLITLSIVKGNRNDGNEVMGTTAEARSEPRGREEEIVKNWVMEHADDPRSVAFAKWGPHDFKGVLYGLEQEWRRKTGRAWDTHLAPAAPGNGVLRLRWREKNRLGALTLHDRIFYLKDGRVVHNRDNEKDEEAWLANAVRQFKENLARPSVPVQM
jgi:hypothetical protein